MASSPSWVAGFAVDANCNSHKPLVLVLSSITAVLLHVSIAEMNLDGFNKSSLRWDDAGVTA